MSIHADNYFIIPLANLYVQFCNCKEFYFIRYHKEGDKLTLVLKSK